MATDKKKRTALDELLPPPAAVSSVVTGAVRRARVKQAPTGKPPRKATGKNEGEAAATVPAVKHEVVKLMLYLPLPVADQLRGLHFEEQRGQAKKRKMHDYCLEAIDLLFKSRGLKSIEELTGKNR